MCCYRPIYSQGRSGGKGEELGVGGAREMIILGGRTTSLRFGSMSCSIPLQLGLSGLNSTLAHTHTQPRQLTTATWSARSWLRAGLDSCFTDQWSHLLGCLPGGVWGHSRDILPLPLVCRLVPKPAPFGSVAGARRDPPKWLERVAGHPTAPSLIVEHLWLQSTCCREYGKEHEEIEGLHRQEGSNLQVSHPAPLLA